MTGANTGLGFQTARALAGKGARVLLGCRARSKAEETKAKILGDFPSADVDIIDIDLGDLLSIKAAAEQVKSEPRLDLLINNAGLMVPPMQKTKDGFESQFGVNHIGTFALTNLLLDKLEETEGARIVNTSSNGHKAGKVRWDNLNAEKGYSPYGQYRLSKLANLLHMYELDRRLKRAGRQTIAVAVHPGGAATSLSTTPAFSGRLLRPPPTDSKNTSRSMWPRPVPAGGASSRQPEPFRHCGHLRDRGSRGYAGVGPGVGGGADPR